MPGRAELPIVYVRGYAGDGEHRPTGTPCGDEDPGSGVWMAHIPLPTTAAPILGEGASVRLTVTPWS